MPDEKPVALSDAGNGPIKRGHSALLCKADSVVLQVLLLDEATSALDSQSEVQVWLLWRSPSCPSSVDIVLSRVVRARWYTAGFVCLFVTVGAGGARGGDGWPHHYRHCTPALDHQERRFLNPSYAADARALGFIATLMAMPVPRFKLCRSNRGARARPGHRDWYA